MLTVLCVALLLLVLTPGAFAATITVGPGQTYTTIQTAINAANAGDAIQVNSGTYNENVNVDRPVSLIGVDTGSGLPVVDGQGGNAAITIAVDNVIVQGFNVTNAARGILITSNNSTVIGNTANNNQVGIYLWDSSDSTVTGNMASNNTVYGIYFYDDTGVSINNTLTRNIANNENYGIFLTYGTKNNSLIGNTANNDGYGINLMESSGNDIVANTANNDSYGITIGETCDNNTLTGNVASDGATGIYLDGYSKNNTLTGNTVCNDSSGEGIYLTYSNNNTIMGTIANNDGYGILIDYEASNNNVAGNHFDNNRAGIILQWGNNNISGNSASDNSQDGIIVKTDNNNVSGNSVINNSRYGMAFIAGSNNDVSQNTIENNTGTGIYIYNANGNVLWLNLIAGNSVNASVIQGASYYGSVINDWNSATPLQYTFNGRSYMNYTGNYWGDYSGPDANGDGIGDTPYGVSGSNIDNYPMLLSAPASPDPVKNLRSGLTFRTIQAAIDDANTVPGDMIQVNAGTYKENVIVDKSVSLVGSGLPVIDGSGAAAAITIHADGVTLQGFNTTNASFGIDIHSNNNTIAGNIASNNTYDGIRFMGMNNNTLTGNTCNNNTDTGIGLYYSSSNNTLAGNACNGNKNIGIDLEASDNNTLTGNTVKGNYYGIYTGSASGNVLWLNVIGGNTNANAAVGGMSLNYWNSTTPLQYTYNDQSHTNYTGNYWSGYSGSDTNGDGIGDTPYTIAANNIDDYPMLTSASSPTPVPYTLSLKQGWNLVSFPVMNASIKASSLNGSGVLIVSSYNRSTGDYDSFNTLVSPLKYDITLRTDAGYFVYCTRDTSIAITGQNPASRSATIYPGWNLVGWSSLNSSTAKSVVSEPSLSGSQIVSRFNASTGDYDSYAEGISPDSYDFTMQEGTGYFVYTNSATPETLYYGV